MSIWFPYAVLAVFPLAGFLTVNPVAFSWGFHRGAAPMPPEIKEKQLNIGRYALLAKDLILLAILWAILARQHIAPARVGIHSHQWPLNLFLGLVVGGLRVLSQVSVRMLVVITKENFNNPEILRGSAFYWISCNLVGALTEELWIALSLVALQSAGRTAGLAILATSCVFGAAHYAYGFGAIAIAIIGAISCTLFLWTGSLLPPVLFHYIGNAGILIWARSALHDRGTGGTGGPDDKS